MAEAGHEVAWEQFILPLSQYKAQHASATISDSVNVEEQTDKLVVQVANISLQFNKSDGCLTSVQNVGEELLLEPVRPNFWRAVTDNDLGNKHHERCAIWKTAWETSTLRSFDWHKDGEDVSISFYAEYLLHTEPVSTNVGI